MTIRRDGRRRAPSRPIGVLVLAVALAGCGSGGAPAAPAWSFAPASGASAPAASPAGGPTQSPTLTPSMAEPSTPAPTATAAAAGSLGSTCAAQWAASVTQYEGGLGQAITAFLLPKSGSDAPVVAPTKLTLQTDKGPVELSGTGPAQGDDSGSMMWGATRLDMGLPALKPGTYRAEFLDATDASGTWRFRIGDFVIHVLPGSPPGDLVREGGSAEEGSFDGGSVSGFELDLHNTTSKPIEVTGASTDIPGLPVTWLFVEGSTQDTFKVAKSVPIPAGGLVKVQVGTMSTARPVSFVLVSPQVSYRLDGSAERQAVYDPVLFETGFGQQSDVLAYRDALPADACGRGRP